MSLKITELRKSYSQGEQRIEVLKGLSADIEEGQVISVVGQSGSGKSTFLSLMAGLEHADSGSIVVQGRDLCGMDERELTDFRARHIGIVFQQYHLVAHLTALENVCLPMEILRRSDAEAKARKLLEELGLGHRLNHFPGMLSGGECQRVAIARALVVEPQLLLADEPSGNLDVETGDKVMDLFFETVARHRTTTLLVTHSEALARRGRRILHLRQGRFEEAPGSR